MLRAGLVGVTGYTGMELSRILASHPSMRLTAATSRQDAGKRLDTVYPFLQGLPGADVTLVEPDAALLARECDVVFLAVPHGVAMEIGAELYDAGVKVVDLSADFRLRDADVYEAWYKPHTRREYIAKAVYGLPELYAADIAKARLVANPGCYPTASILGLYAALKNGIVRTDDIIIDAKSGTTGAGRKAVVSSLYCEVADSFRPYNIGGRHRHTPEIEQELSVAAGESVTVSFNPHLLPISRGILATIYTKLKDSLSQADVQAMYEDFWKDAPWVRVLPAGKLPETRNVRGTMFCDIAVTVDQRTGRLLITSAIDNLCRGASGQAVANANLMFGLPVETGLNFAPLVP
ncbi:N-acetyl-gamma-glutamyl-phosphate reductase [uncultured Mailhella sp.]|uniref:N-acetyl-gamma-glutamyl-phosphate reductase n=1 Tax=uncultured Mailhella sp. TaxID=1981031 RepID=UPI0025D49466|nr:N-acetyl-gamma-glutamyl-phosphate reductase [uncultured Mailhella sp.]